MIVQVEVTTSLKRSLYVDVGLRLEHLGVKKCGFGSSIKNLSLSIRPSLPALQIFTVIGTGC